MKKRLVNFYLTVAQHEALRQVAIRQGRTISEVMRRSIDTIISRDLHPPLPRQTITEPESDIVAE